jgi:hypothetical protein
MSIFVTDYQHLLYNALAPVRPPDALAGTATACPGRDGPAGTCGARLASLVTSLATT